MPAARRLALVLVLAASACKSSDGPAAPRAGSIVVAPDAVTLKQRESTQVVPSVLDQAGALLTGVAVTFKSGNEALVTVSATGLVTSVGPAGSAAIIVSGSGLTKSVPVTVTPVPTTLRVLPTPFAVTQKGNAKLDAQVLDAVGTPIAGSPITYTSGTPSIATVAEDGTVTSVGPTGSAPITVRSGSLTEVVFAVIAPAPTTLSLLPTPMRVSLGFTSRASATVLDAVGVPIANVQPELSIDDPSIATVASDGTVRGVSVGTTTLRATVGALRASVVVNVLLVTRPQGTLAGSLSPCGNEGAYGVATTSTFAYVPCRSSSRVARIDIDAVSATVMASPADHSLSVATASSGTLLYLTQGDGSNAIPRLVVADATTGLPVGTPVDIRGTPFDVVVTRDGRIAYVASAAGIVSVIDLTRRTVTREITLPSGYAIHLALSDDETRLYTSGGMVYEIDLVAGVVRRTLTGTEGGSQDIVLSPSGSTLYYVSESSGSFVAIDLATSASFWSVRTGCGPYGLAISPDGTRAYAACAGALVTVDLETRRVASTLPLAGTMRRLAITPDGRALIIAAEGGPIHIVK